MPLQLILCRLCTHSRPEFRCAVERLAREYPHDLEIIELECMAACDDVPAVMLETDYHPQIAPADLVELVRHEVANLSEIGRLRNY